jgi:hypothetical protein
MRRQEKHIHKAKKRSFTEELLKEIDSLSSQDESRKFYQLVNNLRQDFKPRITACSNINGEIINGMNDFLKRWKQHFKELFSEGDEVSGNMEPNPLSRRATDGEVENKAPTKEEVKQTLLKLKNNRSPGPDTINPELLKVDEPELMDKFQIIMEQVWITEEMPIDTRRGTN